MYFEKLLAYLKLVKDDSVIQDVQTITTAIIKLKFRNLVPTQRILLEKIRAYNRSQSTPSHTFVIETVVSKLYKNSPSFYLDELLLSSPISQEAYQELVCVVQLVEGQDLLVISPETPRSLMVQQRL